MKNKIFVLVAAIVAVGAFLVFKNLSSSESVTKEPMPVSAAEKLIRPHSPSFGNRMGRVSVVEWLDPECESCRLMHPAVKKIMAEYKDRVHFVIRYMPYHGGSMFAAAALEEAKELDKFEAALELLFERQPEWGDHHNPRPELIPEILNQVGVPMEKLNKDYLLQKHSDKIRMDEADGKEVGVRGTPTFFVNGQMLHELGEEPLRAAIESALKAN